MEKEKIMKTSITLIASLLALVASQAQADNNHKDWVIIESMSSPIFNAARNTRSQSQQLVRLDTSTGQGRKAQQLVGRGKIVQNQLLHVQGNEIPPTKAKQLSREIGSLISEMDHINPAVATQGACFKSCDKAYGTGFGKGKGWNRFWCKGSCFKININVGKPAGTGNPSTLRGAQKKSNTGLLLPAVQNIREPVKPAQKSKKGGKVDPTWSVEKGE
jgi:hypothetical protein